ncbi:helix-turn-helix domain-containing protein [Brevundimonas sp.]
MDAVALLARNAQRIRKGLGLSQEEVAFRAGLKRSYLSDLERGTRNPSVRALGRIAHALDVSPSRLLDL